LRAFLSEAISLKPADCFGKKRLAMTAILTLNEYNMSCRRHLFQHNLRAQYEKDPSWVTCELLAERTPRRRDAEILSTENLYKQSKFSQWIETTQLIKAFHPLRCFYLLGLILLYLLAGLRQSFAG